MIYSAPPTASPIRVLIIAICATTLVAHVLDPFFVSILGWERLTWLLSLSWPGLHHLYLWQPITQIFLYPSYGFGLGLGLLINLLFSMYLLWIFGSTVMEYTGARRFMQFFFGSGLISGLCTVGLLAVFGSSAAFSGPMPAILATLFLWTMLSPEAEILFFFLIPIKAKVLMGWLVGLMLLIDLSNGDVVSFVNTAVALLFAYGYGLLAWQLKSPYAITHSFDQAVINVNWQSLKALFKKRSTPESTQAPRNGKIIDINTGEAIENEDDAFVDEMLDKISKRGEGSLSDNERARLSAIAARKRDKK